MGFGPWEVVIILVILVIIFGAGRLTNVSNAVGRGVREFRTAVQEEPKADTTQVAAAPPVVCAVCQSPNPAGNKFCSACGSAMSKPEAEIATPQAAPVSAPSENVCPSCATPNPVGQLFCGQCGTRLTRAA